MTEFICVIIMVVCFSVSFYNVGVSEGKVEQCKTLKAELHDGKCVLVERKEIKL